MSNGPLKKDNIIKNIQELTNNNTYLVTYIDSIVFDVNDEYNDNNNVTELSDASSD